MITMNQVHNALIKRMGEFRQGTVLSISYRTGMLGTVNDELLLEWEDVELKSKDVVGGYPLFLVRCQELETAGIFADLGEAVAEFQRQCALWEAEHGT